MTNLGIGRKNEDKQPSPEANPSNQVPPLPGPAKAGTGPLPFPALPVLLGLKPTFSPCQGSPGHLIQASKEKEQLWNLLETLL